MIKNSSIKEGQNANERTARRLTKREVNKAAAMRKTLLTFDRGVAKKKFNESEKECL